MEMGELYGLPDLRELMSGITYFPALPQGAALMGDCEVGEILPSVVLDFRPHSTSTSVAVSTLCGLDMEAFIGGDGGNNSRWPRQETLNLLEIRSRLHPKFKDANQKGPLWDEVSRLMAKEYGYQRSGKKCREKFENLYKYYKKTKEGKAGRQDGKHYRFFRQLEALYGETTTITPMSTSETQIPLVQAQQKLRESPSLSNPSDFNSSSSEENDNADDLKAVAFMEKRQSHRKRRRTSWKAKIRDFVDSQMKRLVETQEAWLEKILKILERKEQERMSREEAWRKEEAEHLAREYKFWAHERAWVEARDVAIMEALQKFTRTEPKALSKEELVATHHIKEKQIENGNETLDDSINNECNKRREENLKTKLSFRSLLDLPHREGTEEKEAETLGLQFEAIDVPLPSNSNRGNAMHDSCFQYLMAEEEPLWENNYFKLNKRGNFQ